MITTKKLEWLRKRDGRLVAFQKGKIAVAVAKALRTSGKEDNLLAQEIAEAVTLYLAKSAREIPDIETVQDAVERVLVEMKYFEAAKAYILYRDKRARLRRVMRVVRPATQGSGELRWNRARVVRSLAEKLEVPRLLAERIADIVEEETALPSTAEAQLDLLN